MIIAYGYEVDSRFRGNDGWKGYRSTDGKATRVRMEGLLEVNVERVCRKGVVYAALGAGVEHWFPYQENWLRET